MTDIFYDEWVNLKNPDETAAIARFLSAHDLAYEPGDYTVRLLDHNLLLAGTGTLSENIIKCVAVAEPYRDSDAFSRIITHLLDKLASQQQFHAFVFTKPASAIHFEHLGFREIERAMPLISLMEYGIGGLSDYKRYLAAQAAAPPEGRNDARIGAVIVNCNPFTRGHQWLIETAAAACAHLYVIVVEEDRSVFPFQVRYDLVQKGVAELANVSVLKGGKFVVSALTFPTYFLKHENLDLVAQKQAELDVRIFARHIAPTLGINSRFVGTEDYCLTTAAYNRAMQAVLPEFNISLTILNRHKNANADIISASKVRAALKENDWDRIKTYVPETTYAFLKSPEAEPILLKLKEGSGRHG